MKFNYKKNKLDQLKGFCAVVECKNISNAAKLLHISDSSVSLQISSLEKDLGFLLFDRVKNKLALNEKGRAYYKEAKRVLIDLDKIYGGKIIIKVNKYDLLKIKIRRTFAEFKKALLNFLGKIFIKITWIELLLSLFITLFGILFYIYQTNWFFDRKLYKLANPLLKEVMKVGYYRVDKNDKCSLLGAQLNEDMANLLLNLNNNISSGTICVNECPSQAIRMNGKNSIDEIFNTKKAVTCKMEEGYPMLKKLSKLTRNMLDINSNFKIYNLYAKTDCVNYNIFTDNMSKYQNQIFAKQISTLDGLYTGRTWFIKHRNYYYLIVHTNGLQGHTEHLDREHYLIFKKLTRSELINYESGYYWKVIKNYNIKID
jgi:hypothetical protein